MPNNDILFVCEEYPEDLEEPEDSGDPINKIYIYGLKSSCEIYFNDNEENYREINTNTKIIANLVNGAGVIINNKQFILICESIRSGSLCHLIDYENKNIYDEYLYKLLNYDNESSFKRLGQLFSIINLNQQNKILLSYLEENVIDLSLINLSTEDFTSYNIIHNSKRNDNLINTSNRFEHIFCFITEQKLIECTILHVDADQIIVEIYDESLNHLDSILLASLHLERSIKLVNCIHLKNEIGVYAYYPNYEMTPLYIQINKLVFDGSHYGFENFIEGQEVFQITTSGPLDVNQYDHTRTAFMIKTESLKKINDNKFSYAYYISLNKIIIVIFDLYGVYKKSLLIRYYTINLELYNIIIIVFIKLFKFNSFLGLSILKTDESYYDARTGFSIFGYSSKKPTIDLEIYKNNIGFILELKNYFSIDNNLFGYELDIKISSIPKELTGLRLFSINEINEIK